MTTFHYLSDRVTKLLMTILRHLLFLSRKAPVLWVLLLCCLCSFSKAQQKIATYELANPEIRRSEFDNAMVFRELAHPSLRYNGQEHFTFFDAQGNVIFPSKLCHGPSCPDGRVLEQDISVAADVPQKNELGYPMGFSLRYDQIKVGNYVVQVRDSTEKVLHTREFRIVNDEPENLALHFQNAQGGHKVDTLFVSKGQAWNGLKVKLNGDYINQLFRTVSIQGLAMRQDLNELSVYYYDELWDSDRSKTLRLGPSSIVFTRQAAVLPTSKPIFLTAPRPEILGSALEFQVEEGQSKKKVTLQAANLYKNAKILLKNTSTSPNFLKSAGWRTGKIDEIEGTVSFDVIFEPVRNDFGSFLIALQNEDGKISGTKTIRFSKKSTSVKTAPLEPRKPLVSGMRNQLRFVRLNGPLLNTEENQQYTLRFDNFDPIPIVGKRETANSFIASVLFPENLPSGTLRFELENNGRLWHGEIKGIRKKPRLKTGPRTIFKGGTTMISIDNAKDVLLQLEKPSASISLSQPENNSLKTFTLKVDERCEDFVLVVKLLDHDIERIAIKTVHYPTPASLKPKDIVNTNNLLKGNTIVLDHKREQLRLHIPTNHSKITPESKFYAQLYKKNGTPIGSKRAFLPDNKNQLSTTLNTQIGLNPGEEFDILVTNPNDDSKTYRGYIKRRELDKWIITAGLSAIDYRFKDSDQNENQAKVLDGINFGFYYMPENFENPNTRFIGYGMNAILVGEGDQIEIRLAGSVLLLEKIVFGLSYGAGGAGFLAGVNIELADFSSLLGR